MNNTGTINGTVILTGGQYLYNSPTGLIATNNAQAVHGTNSPNTVANEGTIATTGTFSSAIYFRAGGTVTNGSPGATGALITAQDSLAVQIHNQRGTVTNFGTITDAASNESAIYLPAGGIVTNGASGSSAALIMSPRNGIATGTVSGAGTVTNFGTIISTTPAAASFGNGVYLGSGGGRITNMGGGLIQSSRNGILVNGASTIENSGTVISTGTGRAAIKLTTGSVTNEAGGLLSGYSFGVQDASVTFNGTTTAAGTATIANSGTIAASAGDGVYLAAGGVLSNGQASAISGTKDSVYIAGAGTVTNHGAITGAVGLNLNNAAGADDVVTNAGTIAGTGGTAVQLGAGQASLVIDPGAVFQGAIAGLQAGDTLDFVQVAADAETFSNGMLTLTKSGATVASIALAGQYRSQDFALASDGQGGTTITLHDSTDIALLDTTTGQTIQAIAQPYSGPVSGLQSQFVYSGSDAINISVSTDDWFLHGGPKDDALQAFGGYNVLDGGTGSNFLTGGSGTDTFFVDDRTPSSDIWSTVNHFRKGDDATVFGVVPTGNNTFQWLDNQGAAGFTGLTLHVFTPNAPTASLTLPGYSSSDLGNGRLSVQFGSETDGTPFMHILAFG